MHFWKKVYGGRTFQESKNKSTYMYILTPEGISEKLVQTQAILRGKTKEYELLRQEID
jgi:hypothetical protein